ncbi:aspartate-semialdehyde dehydrogenase [candidate division KSB1 bacterium]
MKVAVVGATGLVGNVMLQLLENNNYLKVFELILVASNKSIGRELFIKRKSHHVIGMEEAISLKPDVAIFSAGSAISKEWTPKFAKAGTKVIDNSSVWRMVSGIPLIVPEINAQLLRKEHMIISNPNCSTIALVMVLAPLHKQYRIKRVVVSTYQSVTGTGAKAVQQLQNERKGIKGEMVYPYPIDLNIIPQGGDFSENGYTLEEIKLIDETKKIMEDDSIQLTSTVVRVPVFGGHSESVNIEFEVDYDLKEIKTILENTSGILVQDDITKAIYPMPLFSEGKDDVFVGRIRRDFSMKNALNMWIVSDNLRKGAATNAVQIAAYLVKNGFVQ